MIRGVGYGLAGFLLLATSGIDSRPADAQVKSLQDVPLQIPPKISPWPETPDPQLQETARVLFDAVGLINTDPKLAAEVLPYGGKPMASSMATATGPAPTSSVSH